MKKLALMMLLLGLALLGCVDNASPPLQNGSNHILYIAVGQEFDIALDSNPTTGYAWHVAQSLNEQNLQLVTHKYVMPQTSRLGAGGQEVFTFKAIGRGTSRIYFDLTRTWNTNEKPSQQQIFEVIVK